MFQSRQAPAFTPNLLKNGVLLICLLVPSAWLVATIPPLWRDSDAYLQLTLHPLVTTFWGHAPAYSYLAKLPLFLGEHIERWRGIGVAGAENGLPQLTDTGVWLLIIGQHLALVSAGFYFIRSLSQFFWIRLAVALVWASNPLFYTYAHCTGSETLSVIFVVLLVAKALRLIRTREEPQLKDWYLFAVVLWLCLLSRHANVWLILMLPGTFALSWAWSRLAGLVSPGERHGRAMLAARPLRQATIALAIGIACGIVASSWTAYVARKTKLHPHSRLGYTFLWRLQFLKNLPPPARTALLQKVSDRTSSPDVRKLLALLGQVHDEGTDVVGRSFVVRAAPLLFPTEAQPPWEKLDEKLNELAYTFLLPPTAEHLAVTRSDFAAALTMGMHEIPNRLFSTTAYFFEHRDEMPACANLVTFRNTTAETINAIPFQHPYFQLWRGLSYNKAFLFWLASLFLFLTLARLKKASVGAIPAFGIALIAIGLLMTASACLLVDFLPRYGLTMWQLLLLSFWILIAASADLLATMNSRTHTKSG
jgi:hypothetical protein